MRPFLFGRVVVIIGNDCGKCANVSDVGDALVQSLTVSAQNN